MSGADGTEQNSESDVTKSTSKAVTLLSAGRPPCSSAWGGGGEESVQFFFRQLLGKEQRTERKKLQDANALPVSGRTR